MDTPNPKTRRAGLVIEALPDELLIYDEKSYRAHCLNASAAAVFRSADGSLSAAEIARVASESLKAPFTEDLVWLALQELEKNDLLETPLPLVPQGLTRRDALGVGAAVLLPLVLAITAPTPAFAQSGVTGPTGPVGSSTAPPL